MLSAALVFALAFAACTPAQTSLDAGALEGRVLDSHGKPVANASVTIQTSDGLHPHATHTDGSGHFEFISGGRRGHAILRAYYKGSFSEWSKRQLIRPRKPPK